MTEDDKKEILSSDEKGAAKSTLGGAVAGAVVGTAVGTPVVGTLIGAVSGAVMGARKRGSKSPPTKRRIKAKTSPAKGVLQPKLRSRSPSRRQSEGWRQSLQRVQHEGPQSRHRNQAALSLGESAPSRSRPGRLAVNEFAIWQQVYEDITPSTRSLAISNAS
jgi:phage tail tape-measure protein